MLSGKSAFAQALGLRWISYIFDSVRSLKMVGVKVKEMAVANMVQRTLKQIPCNQAIRHSAGRCNQHFVLWLSSQTEALLFRTIKSVKIFW